ncbi:MAG: DUF4347 domain-containing protein, partial [Gammaproteobacteria bacterium]|nr:DUF4347 domain-containing protein [Gammaproteobacteria bacterium]
MSMVRKVKNKPDENILSNGVKSIYKRYRQGFYRPNLLLTLEKRQMFDGAAGALLAEDLDDPELNGVGEELPTPETQNETGVHSSSTESPSTQDDPDQETSENTEEENAVASDGSLGTAGEEATVDEAPDSTSSADNTTSTIEDAVSIDEAVTETVSVQPTGTADEELLDTSDALAGDSLPSESVQQTQVADETIDELDEPDTDEDSTVAATDPEEEVPDQYGNTTVAPEDDDSVTEVVFVDSGVEGYEVLLDSILSDLTQGDDEEGDEEDVAEQEPTLESLLGEFNYDTESTTSETGADDPLDETEEETAEATSAQGGAQSYLINGTLVYVLDQQSSAIDQITDVLAEQSDLAAIHIVSHGAVGQVRLGNESIDNTNLSDYAEILAQWGDALSENGDILLAGCEIGQDVTGMDFLESFADLTKADIAASDDDTGNAAQGGDWELEVAVGSVEAEMLLDAGNAAAFAGLLAPGDGDTDDDGIPDDGGPAPDDLDSDNDGILDADESAVPLGQINFNSIGVGTVIDVLLDNGQTVEVTVDSRSSGSATIIDGNGTGDLTFNANGGNPQPSITFSFNAQVDIEVSQVQSNTNLVNNGGAFDRSETWTISSAGATFALSDPGSTEIADPKTSVVAAFTNNIVFDGGTYSDSISFTPTNQFTQPSAASNWALTADGITTITITYDAISGTNRGDIHLGILSVQTDSDSDGIPDQTDLDSDNDGISDLVESGNAAAITADANSDGTLSGAETGGDADSDGVMDAVDGDQGGTATVVADSDSDGIEDFIDLDSDADGIADAIEAVSTADYTANGSPYTAVVDVDSDGVIDGAPGAGFDSNALFGGDFVTPEDTDEDGTADFLDTDSDNDTLTDAAESGLTLSGIDADSDGIDDDASIGASYADPDGVINGPLDGAPDLLNVDVVATDVDFRSINDTDG